MMLRGLNLTNGYMSVEWDKSKSTVRLKIFNNNNEIVFNGDMTGYDFTKMILFDKAPIEGTISFDDGIEALNGDNELNVIKIPSNITRRDFYYSLVNLIKAIDKSAPRNSIADYEKWWNDPADFNIILDDKDDEKYDV